MSTTPKVTSHQLLKKRAIADLYFLEHCANLIDIAAFIDRYDRGESNGDDIDFRMAALSKACLLLTDLKSIPWKRYSIADSGWG